MSEEQATKARLGALLVEAGALSAEKLRETLERQANDPRRPRLGELLVEAQLIDEVKLTQILGRQLSVPWVSLRHVDFTRQLLNLVPRELAESFKVVPVYVRKLRGQGETLYVATDDPTHEEALARIAAYVGLPVRAMIAPSSEIRSALRVYYGVPPTRASQSREPAIASNAAPNALLDARLETQRPSAPPDPESFDDAPELEAKPIAIPIRGKRPGISLTLLDGTTLSLPKPRKPDDPDELPPSSPSAEKEEELTARDLVAALRAVARGVDAVEILGKPPQWEPIVAALLSVLLRKRLVADWELVEELTKK
jgi:type IV pilus assembly protein PilB